MRHSKNLKKAPNSDAAKSNVDKSLEQQENAAAKVSSDASAAASAVSTAVIDKIGLLKTKMVYGHIN